MGKTDQAIGTGKERYEKMLRSMEMRLWRAAGVALLLVGTVFAAEMPVTGFPPKLPSADLVLRNGVIVTLDVLQPKVQALAIRDGRIEAMGSDEAITHYVGPNTKVMDLRGAFVTPGFIEGHGHLLGTGLSLMELNVGKAPNWDAVVAMVKAAVAKAKPGEWIVGTGWQQSKWNKVPQPNVDGLPLPQSLDSVSPNNPVLLEHVSGHAVYANAEALKLAGITGKTPDPPGGSIVHDAQGNPIGVLRDTADNPVFSAYSRYVDSLPPQEVAARSQKALELAVHDGVSNGITTFVDMGENFKTIDWLKEQAGKGLPLRLYININDEAVSELNRHLAEHRVIGYANNHFTVRGIGEILSDGALGTRSAWFLQPYNDAPDVSGKNVIAMSEIMQIAEIAARDGFQVSVHAIGDRANRETLDVYEKVFTEDPASHALRWRIEHVQHLNPADTARFAQLGVIASMQSIHACSDAPFVVGHLGEKRAREGAYVWHSLLERGTIVLDGTDTPVEDTNPIANFYCGVTRDQGKDRYFFPEQVKTRMEELRSYTQNNAYAIFEDDLLGTLTPGKLADIDVFSGDLFTMPADQILRTRVLYTIIDGKVVYERSGASAWHKGELFAPMPEFNHLD